jgi:hypothetical protein
MTYDLLLWIYLANAIILINHEIDSAYWQEWKLINPNIKNGINGFLLLHLPLTFLVLYGLVLINNHSFAGLIISIMLSASGLFAFFFHTYHLRKGRPEFNTIISKTIIYGTFITSIVQMIVTIVIINNLQ